MPHKTLNFISGFVGGMISLGIAQIVVMADLSPFWTLLPVFLFTLLWGVVVIVLRRRDVTNGFNHELSVAAGIGWGAAVGICTVFAIIYFLNMIGV